MMNIIWRLVRAGLVAALVVGLSGWAYERAHFGASDSDALARIEAELRQRFAASADVEQVLGRIRGSPVLAHTFVVPTSIVPVSVSAQVGDAVPDRAPYAFVIRSPAGGPLVVAEVSPDDLAQARARWRSRTWAAVWSVLAIALLLCAGPLVELRRRSRDRR